MALRVPGAGIRVPRSSLATQGGSQPLAWPSGAAFARNGGARCCVASGLICGVQRSVRGCSSMAAWRCLFRLGGAKTAAGFATGAAVAGFFIEQNGVISLEASCSLK